MHAEKHVIVGVHITDRVKHASEVQKILTQYGCQIKTRLGLHDVDVDFCSPNGLLLLELVADAKTCAALIKKLQALRGVQVKKMVFNHD